MSYLRFQRVLVLFGLVAVLAACSDEISHIDLKATAVSTECWPGNYPTPRAITVTPAEPTTTATAGVGTPTATALPTTTPYPRCTPIPGQPTSIPYPTALPTPVAYPTDIPRAIQGGSDTQLLMDLPGIVHNLDMAVHPAYGWPAVVATNQDWSGTPDPDHRRIFAQVYNPRARTWGRARQLNVPPEDGNGGYGGVAVGITGDGTVHVAWGGAFTPNKPVWYTNSTDYGETWSTPITIGQGCYNVQDVATTLDGQLVVLALCTPTDTTQWDVWPGLIQRRADGTWLPKAEIRVDGRWGSVVLVGDGDEARAVALLANHSTTGTGYIIQKRLADPGGWQVQSKDLSPPPGYTRSEATYYLFRAMSFTRPNGTDGLTFTWSVYGANAIYAITSLDGGQSWGNTEAVVVYHDPEEGQPPLLDHRFSAPAYDARADRLAILYVASDTQSTFPPIGTHYAGWSVPGSGRWFPSAVPGSYQARIPLVTGAERAAYTATAQTSNASYFWLAWVDRYQHIKVRSLDLNLIIPIDQYPHGGS